MTISDPTDPSLSGDGSFHPLGPVVDDLLNKLASVSNTMQTQDNSTIATDFRSLMKAAAAQNAARAASTPKAPAGRPTRPARPAMPQRASKERDYAMMETWLKQNRPGYRLRAMLQTESVDLISERDFARPDMETCERLVAEDPTILTAHSVPISEVLMRATKYEDVRKALPMLEEVPLGRWVAGEAPIRAAIIADHAMREPIEEVLLFVATVLTFASMPKDRVEAPAFTPSRSSQSSPERAELPHKAAMRRKSGKAFQLKARKTEELKADFWSLLSKKRGHYAEVRLAKIDAEFQRRGVDVFHSKN